MAITRARAAQPLKAALKLLAFALVVNYLILPLVPGVRKSLSLLSQVSLSLLAVAVLLELASILAYTRLTRSVLPCAKDKHAERPSMWTLLRIQLSTLAVSHVVPGGSAAGSSLGFRLLTASGVRGTDAAFALATQGLGSAVVLNMLLLIALVVSIPRHGFNPYYLTAAVLGVLLMIAAAAVVVLLVRGEERAAVLIRRVGDKLPFLDGDSLEQVMRRIASRMQELARDRELVRRAVLWATANWLLDAGSLYVFLGAFGKWMSPESVLVSFGLFNVLAVLPLLPAGAGLEFILISTLTGFGAGRGVATLGVITYRLVNFWLPIPLGGLAYLSLEFVRGKERPVADHHRGRELRRVAEESMSTAGDRKTWGDRYGLRVKGRPRVTEDPAED